MQTVELRDPSEARRYLTEGLWLQGIARPTAESVRPALAWSLALVAEGYPLLPIGVVADIGNVAFGSDRSIRTGAAVPGWPATLARGYEDHVLGKLHADALFERASDALRTYPDADRARGLAFLVNRIRETLGQGGVTLPPGILRSLLAAGPGEVLSEGYESLSRDGVRPLIRSQYEELIAAVRRTAELIGPEDVTALEQRTALAEFGQYVAHRQILLAAARIAARFPARPVAPYAGRREVPTAVTDEDVYPVGGYSSVSTKGTIESLLHSQLAYMEPEERPDLFDVKFVRDELYYYSRDENEFLRRRRAFVAVFDPSLTAARFKDPSLPTQRIVFVQAVIVAVVTALLAWLRGDALRFELVFPRVEGRNPQAHEAELFEVLFREAIARGEVAVEVVESVAAAEDRIRHLAIGRQTNALWIGTADRPVVADRAAVARLVVAGPEPVLIDGHGETVPLDAETPGDVWSEAALNLLRLWV